MSMVTSAELSWMQQIELRERDHVEEVSQTVAQWLRDAGPEVDPVLLRRMQLVDAMADTRRGQIEQGAAVMREIRSWATAHDEPYLQARAERLLGILLRRAGEATTSLEHAIMSVQLLADDEHPDIRADHLTGLADALASGGSSFEAIGRYEEAERLTAEHGNTELQMLVINNLAYTYYEINQVDDAARECDHLVALTAERQVPLPMYALDTVAAIFLAAGRLDDAERLFDEVELNADSAADDIAQAQLTLVRIRHQRGDVTGAQQALDSCLVTCAEHDLGAVEVLALREQSALSAAENRYDLAFGQFKQYHERFLAQRGVEREARARMMQAIFETSEARRESERFREMSYRDPLTKLHNRRYVDEHLTPLLHAALETAQPISVAFVDLDFFKKINDTCSHEVGDEVLRRVAWRLDQCAALIEGGFAARMGGEEFLLVLPGRSAEQAGMALEEVRRQIAQLEWDGLTHELPVTASLGSATAPEDGTDRLPLLACADRRLYAAKAAGRNRVVQSDPPAADAESSATNG